MNTNIYRPLIKITNSTNDTYLPLEYTYTLTEINKIKKYLPKSLTYVGVDASSLSSVEKDKAELDKQKLKIKAVNGSSTAGSNNLLFYQNSDLEVVIWQNVFLCVNIPFNSKQDPSDCKGEIDSKLTNYIEHHLIFRNIKTGQSLDRSSPNTLPLQELDLFFEPININPEHFDTHYRQIRFVLPILAFLVKKQEYSPKEIYQSIEEDVLSSIKILIKNKFSIRIVKKSERQNEVLALQSYVNHQNQISGEESRLSSLLNKVKSQIQIQQQTEDLVKEEKSSLSEQLMANPHRRDLSNRSLVLILSGMFLLYIFLKVNPLEKIISDGL